MNRPSIALFAAALASALACGAPQDGELSAAGGAALRTTAFSDSFNAYDSSTWEMANWANGNPFNCGFLPDHVTFSNGAMTLKLDNTASSGKSYSGGEYRTKDTFSYGRYEVRMKAAKASGIVSSFFTYTGSPWDEIDIEFLGKNTTQVQFNYYVNGQGGHERIVDLGFDASAAYHTYAFDWQPNSISWYVDGVLKHTATGSTSTLPSHPQQIMMNLWNGIGVDGWLGSFSYPGALYASYDSVSYTPPGATGYTLGVSKSGNGSGTVTSNTGGINCGSTYSATITGGTTVTLNASAASGSTFGGWSGACSGTGACIVTMNSAQSVTATFSAQQVSYALGVSKSGNGSGTVTSSTGGINCGATCSATYTSGTVVTLNASAASGSLFGGWSGACSGTGACIVTMSSAQSVGATFTAQQVSYALGVSKSGNGSGTVSSNTGGISCGSTCSATYTSGTVVTLNASAASGSLFGGWSGACSGTGACIVTMSSAQSVGATFTAQQTGYALSISKSGAGVGTVTSNVGGIDCGSTCSATYTSGTVVTLTASAASGSTFAGWSGACAGTGICAVTVASPLSVTATFASNQQQGGPVSINAGGAASGTFVGDTNFSGGSAYTVSTAIDTSQLVGTIVPQAVLQTERYGEFTYTIPGLTAGSAYAVTLYFDEVYWTAAGQRTFNVAINGATVLSAFDIFAAAGGANKAISRTFNTTADAGGQVVIAFTKGGGANNPKVCAITIGAGGPVVDTYALSVTRNGTGSGTVAGGAIDCGGSCSASFTSGATVTLTAAAAAGSTFAGWSGDCSGTSPLCTLTMSAARTATATFNVISTGDTCKTASGGQSGNFNTTGAICFTVSATIHGWGCSNADGRSVTVNGTAVTCGQLPLPGSAPYTFSFTGGSYPWASFYWW